MPTVTNVLPNEKTYSTERLAKIPSPTGEPWPDCTEVDELVNSLWGYLRHYQGDNEKRQLAFLWTYCQARKTMRPGMLSLGMLLAAADTNGSGERVDWEKHPRFDEFMAATTRPQMPDRTCDEVLFDERVRARLLLAAEHPDERIVRQLFDATKERIEDLIERGDVGYLVEIAEDDHADPVMAGEAARVVGDLWDTLARRAIRDLDKVDYTFLLDDILSFLYPELNSGSVELGSSTCELKFERARASVDTWNQERLLGRRAEYKLKYAQDQLASIAHGRGKQIEVGDAIKVLKKSRNDRVFMETFFSGNMTPEALELLWEWAMNAVVHPSGDNVLVSAQTFTLSRLEQGEAIPEPVARRMRLLFQVVDPEKIKTLCWLAVPNRRDSLGVEQRGFYEMVLKNDQSFNASSVATLNIMNGRMGVELADWITRFWGRYITVTDYRLDEVMRDFEVFIKNMSELQVASLGAEQWSHILAGKYPADIRSMLVGKMAESLKYQDNKSVDKHKIGNVR